MPRCIDADMPRCIGADMPRCIGAGAPHRIDADMPGCIGWAPRRIGAPMSKTAEGGWSCGGSAVISRS